MLTRRIWQRLTVRRRCPRAAAAAATRRSAALPLCPAHLWLLLLCQAGLG